ncbi:peptidoglycan-associated lipoprotein Pal [Thermodesulfobacteriota bacterium]
MRKKLWIILALLLVIPGLLFTVSCAKKAVKSDAELEQQQATEQARQEEMVKQQAMEEEMQAQTRRKMAAKNRFLNENIHFEFDRSNLLPEAQEILRSKAQWLRDNPDVLVIIEGHCDERGTNEYNLALGDRRANSAKAYLADIGIAGARLTCISYGEEKPLDPGHNQEAWAKNRRAQFTID